jgi:hypothetical protein
VPETKPPKDFFPAQPPGTPPDDGPEDMELTAARPVSRPLNAADSVFTGMERGSFRGINTQPSVFARGTLFHAP